MTSNPTSRVSQGGLKIKNDLTVLNKVEKDSMTTRSATDGQPKSPDGQRGTPFPSLKLGECAELPHACDLIEVLKGSHAISPQKGRTKIQPRGPLECSKSHDLGLAEPSKTSRSREEIGSDLRVVQNKLDSLQSLEQELLAQRRELEGLKLRLQNELSPVAPLPKAPLKEVSGELKGELTLLADIRDTLRKMRLPRLEIEPFSGAPKDFIRFTSAFDTIVGRKVTDPSLRLAYLIQHCTGKARKAIEYCALLPDTICYETAIQNLTKYFGTPSLISEAVLKDLRYGPPVKMDLQHMESFMTELSSSHAVLSRISMEDALDKAENLVDVLKRLPERVKLKWLALVGRIGFQDLVDIIEEHLSLLSGDYAILLREPPDPPERCDESNVHCVTTVQASSSPKRHLCILCRIDHDLESCPSFIKMGKTRRRKVLSDHKRCFLCLKANHLARSCKSGRQCSQSGCGGRHHELVHLRNGFSRVDGTTRSETISAAAAKEPPDFGT